MLLDTLFFDEKGQNDSWMTVYDSCMIVVLGNYHVCVAWNSIGMPKIW